MTLIDACLKKEKKIFKRNWSLHKRFSWIGKILGFSLIFILLEIAHLPIFFMHFIWETFLWIFKRERFRKNLVKMYQTS